MKTFGKLTYGNYSFKKFWTYNSPIDSVNINSCPSEGQPKISDNISPYCRFLHIEFPCDNRCSCCSDGYLGLRSLRLLTYRYIWKWPLRKVWPLTILQKYFSDLTWLIKYLLLKTGLRYFWWKTKVGGEKTSGFSLSSFLAHRFHYNSVLSKAFQGNCCGLTPAHN